MAFPLCVYYTVKANNIELTSTPRLLNCELWYSVLLYLQVVAIQGVLGLKRGCETIRTKITTLLYFYKYLLHMSHGFRTAKALKNPYIQKSVKRES